jgi:ABC-2 type transport system ATP-binding protein
MYNTIAAEGLGKRFGETTAVDDISFTVSPGEIFGLLGPNGAGKTTVVRMLTTLLQIGAGAGTVSGHDVASQPNLVRQCIGLAGQAAAVDEKLTARENLELFGRLYHLSRRSLATRIDELLEQFRLMDFADRPTETYSGGQRRRLDLAASLVANPPALFLDEPTTGLDPRSRNDMWEAVRALAATGTAIVLTTQYLEEADQLADQLLVIDQGQAVASGTPAQLKSELQSDVLEVKIVNLADLDAATKAAAEIVPDSMAVAADKTVHVPMPDGAEHGIQVLKRIDAAGIRIADFELRRPTLDDVFLSLTAHRTTSESQTKELTP